MDEWDSFVEHSKKIYITQLSMLFIPLIFMLGPVFLHRKKMIDPNIGGPVTMVACVVFFANLYFSMKKLRMLKCVDCKKPFYGDTGLVPAVGLSRQYNTNLCVNCGAAMNDQEIS